MNDKQGFSYLLKVSVTVNVLSLMRILQIVTLQKVSTTHINEEKQFVNL